MLIIFGFVLMFGVAYLQSKLSSKSNKFLGLVFPLISLIFSVLLISITYVCDGFSFVNILGFIFLFVLYNISTITLLLIYYLGRKSAKEMEQIKELTKMNICDLK
jgi:hypothetical protein